LKHTSIKASVKAITINKAINSTHGATHHADRVRDDRTQYAVYV
jgi:hypothetical protein